MASFWGTYSVGAGWLDGVQIGGGVRYVGESDGDRLNTFDVPAYTLLDAYLNYDMSALGRPFDGWNVSVNATNLTDKTFVASCRSSNSCYYGVGRSVIARLKYQW